MYFQRENENVEDWFPRFYKAILDLFVVYI